MEKMTFSPNVLLVDAVWLNRVGADMARHFASVVGRDLGRADLALLLECLALDAGVQPGNDEVQVIFVYDGSMEKMGFCEPSGLADELHEVAFESRLGEFSLYSFQPSGMASREELFLEALQLAGEAENVRRIAAVPDEGAYGAKVWKAVGEWKKAVGVTVFGMNPPEPPCSGGRFELAGFAVLQSLGVRADEL